MYRVLFATNEPAVLEPLNQITNWQSMSFHDPVLAGNADEAIRLMESKRVDAIAYMLNADEARKLSLYLNNMRPSLPIFQIQRTLDAQKEEIINVRRLLDRLHADMSDEVYDEAAVLAAVAGWFLWQEHRAHLYGALPFVLLLACPLMHIFGHGHHHGNHEESDKK